MPKLRIVPMAQKPSGADTGGLFACLQDLPGFKTARRCRPSQGVAEIMPLRVEPVAVSSCPSRIGWIYSGFETNVRSAGARDWTFQRSRTNAASSPPLRLECFRFSAAGGCGWASEPMRSQGAIFRQRSYPTALENRPDQSSPQKSRVPDTTANHMLQGTRGIDASSARHD